MKYNHKTLALIAVIIAVVVTGAIILNVRHNRNVAITSEGTEVTEVPVTEPAKPKKAVPANNTQPASLTVTYVQPDYASLLAEYEGRTIQFGANCAAVPASATFKVGTVILLDNRSSEARAIGVNGSTFQLGAYGYKNIVLGQVGSYGISCGTAKNVATITVQE